MSDNESECEHVRALRKYLAVSEIEVYSEHGEEPAGWVNVRCERCKRVYETTLRNEEEEE